MTQLMRYCFGEILFRPDRFRPNSQDTWVRFTNRPEPTGTKSLVKNDGAASQIEPVFFDHGSNSLLGLHCSPFKAFYESNWRPDSIRNSTRSSFNAGLQSLGCQLGTCADALLRDARFSRQTKCGHVESDKAAANRHPPVSTFLVGSICIPSGADDGQQADADVEEASCGGFGPFSARSITCPSWNADVSIRIASVDRIVLCIGVSVGASAGERRVEIIRRDESAEHRVHVSRVEIIEPGVGVVAFADVAFRSRERRRRRCGRGGGGAVREILRGLRERAAGVGAEPDRLRVVARQPRGDSRAAGADGDGVGVRIFRPGGAGKLDVRAEVERRVGGRDLLSVAGRPGHRRSSCPPPRRAGSRRPMCSSACRSRARCRWRRSCSCAGRRRAARAGGARSRPDRCRSRARNSTACCRRAHR